MYNAFIKILPRLVALVDDVSYSALSTDPSLSPLLLAPDMTFIRYMAVHAKGILYLPSFSQNWAAFCRYLSSLAWQYKISYKWLTGITFCCCRCNMWYVNFRPDIFIADLESLMLDRCSLKTLAVSSYEMDKKQKVASAQRCKALQKLQNIVCQEMLAMLLNILNNIIYHSVS